MYSLEFTFILLPVMIIETYLIGPFQMWFAGVVHMCTYTHFWTEKVLAHVYRYINTCVCTHGHDMHYVQVHI